MRIPGLVVLLCLAGAVTCLSQTRQAVVLRGHEQTVYVYGSPGGDPVIVSSGDGGWIHLGPSVSEFLASRGFFVIGLDVRAYLSSFTASSSTLRPEDEPGDFKVLVQRARAGSGKRPILIGVSAGAGLSVLAAGDESMKSEIAGVIGLGLPDRTELAWRLKDSLIYLTHRTPNEPTFSTAEVINKVAPLPVAAIHSTGDEFVPVSDVQNILNRARDPKRLWVVKASNHRFSDNLQEFDRRLIEAIAWVKQNAPR
jgi:fermentation-respiration switch protein FrsA (DUF1100 family)